MKTLIMKKILLVSSILIISISAMAQPNSALLMGMTDSIGIIKGYDNTRCVATLGSFHNKYDNLVLINMTVGFPQLCYGARTKDCQRIDDIYVTNSEIFFCGIDSSTPTHQGFIAHTVPTSLVGGNYEYLLIPNLERIVKLVAYPDPGSTTGFIIVAFGHSYSTSTAGIVVARYASGSGFSTSYELHTDNIHSLWSFNILPTVNKIAFLYRKFYDNTDYQIVVCDKAAPFATNIRYDLTGSSILRMQNITGTPIHDDNIAIAYYSNIPYSHQYYIHQIKLPAADIYNTQIIRISDKSTPPPMTYIPNDHSLVALLENTHPFSTIMPANYIPGSSSFVYINLFQSSPYATQWVYPQNLLDFHTISTFSDNSFIGSAPFSRYFYFENKNNLSSTSCFHYFTSDIDINNKINMSPAGSLSSTTRVGVTGTSSDTTSTWVIEACIF